MPHVPALSAVSSARFVRSLFRASLAALLLTGAAACTNTLKYDAAGQGAASAATADTTQVQAELDKMSDRMLTHPAVLSYILAKRPLMAVDTVVDLTGRPLQTNILNASLREKIAASDSFRLIDGDRLVKARASIGIRPGEPLDDAAHAQQIAKTLGADLVLCGEVSEVIRSTPTTRDAVFQIRLRMIDRKTGGVAWQDSQDIPRTHKNIIYGI